MTRSETRLANLARAEAEATPEDTTCPGCDRRLATPPLIDLGPSHWLAPARWCQGCGGSAALREENR